MKLTPSLKLFIFGLILFAALFLWARYRGRDGGPPFLVPLAVAGVGYLLTIRELARTPKLAPRVAGSRLDYACGVRRVVGQPQWC